MVKMCEQCEVNKSDEQREPMPQDAMPQRPGEELQQICFHVGAKIT